MKNNPPSNLRKKLSRIISIYVTKFEEKHECYLEYCVADDDLGIFVFGDNFFNLNDIIEDIENNYPKDAIFEWQNYITDHNSELENVSKMRLMNLKSYIAGFRF